MKKIKILIACEESQALCIEFRNLGFEAFSCDIQECSGGHPEWHIKGDAIAEAYTGKYDLMIAHPPCTFISHAGARWLYPKGILNEERYAKGKEAVVFFNKLLNAPINHIVIENPKPTLIYNLPLKTQIIEPYYFGDEAQKKTYLWIKNLPLLKHTNIVGKGEFITYPSGRTKAAWFMNIPSKQRAKIRSKTFPGIAKAMAQQWGEYLNKLP